MKVIIAGGRTFADRDLLFDKCDEINKDCMDVTEVVSGKARGADTLGEEWAKHRHLPVSEFPANWSKYNKAAGYIRNQKMAEHAEGLIAFWDGESKGTKHMIELAEKEGLAVYVVPI